MRSSSLIERGSIAEREGARLAATPTGSRLGLRWERWLESSLPRAGPTQREMRMSSETDFFKHSTPALYDRYMVPLLFEPYARLVAERAAFVTPSRILETAAGTGVVTRLVNAAVVTNALAAWDGKDAPMSAHVVTAGTKPS